MNTPASIDYDLLRGFDQEGKQDNLMEARPGAELRTRVQIYAAAWLKVIGTQRALAPVDDYTLMLLTSLEKVRSAKRSRKFRNTKQYFRGVVFCFSR